MNIFGFRPFKGKFNLGKSEDIPTNTDGTLIGAVKEINASLTANNNTAQLTYSSGKYGFTIGGTFYALGGEGMVYFDWSNPIKTLTQETSWTVTQKCVLFGQITGISNTLEINGTAWDGITTGSNATAQRMDWIPVDVGDTVKAHSTTNQGGCNIKAYAPLT